ncbi:phosphatase PAP2 family protein [Ornithinimicrobium faecis]|uniref:phosphatase PAP2 family protein n=1 Tax=Ornithinimicrobium faecis TaxID=2934158 RepID=UPI00211912D8|nr:phosphatase PAP2 family protein [Ornithinimicrobium sp. HY1745]
MPRTAGLWWGATMLLLGVVGTWLTWGFFVATASGQRLDEAAFSGSRIGRRTLWTAAEPVLQIVSVPFLILVLIVAGAVALARQRWVLLVQVSLLIGGANLTTQVLKKLILDRPDLVEAISLRDNSLPSGHTTVAASVAVALLLAVPRSARPLVAVLGGAYAATTGVSTMIGAWHRPSDVIAAFTVVLAWAGVTTMVAALARPEHAGPDRGVPGAVKAVSGLLGLGALVCGAMGVITLVRTHELLATVAELTERSELATAYVGSALGVVAAAAALFALALVGHEVASRRSAQPELTR